MIATTLRRLSIGAAFLASCVAPAAAQTFGEDPNSALTRHLRTLSEEPRSLTSLLGAGDAALTLGDAQAAATFFARAEEVAPRDGRVKSALGRAFVQMEQPEAALRFFGEALSLGMPEASLAGDRGLAYDMLGQTARAQRDYRLALGGADGDEVRRRLALSLAIGGDRAGALQAIDGQLRRQDRAAWRTRAFVLALTGDVAEAVAGAERAMPGTGAALRPFFDRFAGLDAAGRAMAVHFGHFPKDAAAAPVRVAQATIAPPPLSATRTASPVSTREARSRPTTAERRRPEQTARAEAPRPTSRLRNSSAFGSQRVQPPAAGAGTKPVELAAATPRTIGMKARSEPAVSPVSAPITTSSQRSTQVAAAPARQMFGPASTGSAPMTATVPAPAPAVRTLSGIAAPYRPLTLASAPPAPIATASAILPVALPPSAPAASASPPSISTPPAQPGFASLASTIAALTDVPAAVPESQAVVAPEPAKPAPAPAPAAEPPVAAPPKKAPAAQVAAKKPAEAPSAANKSAARKGPPPAPNAPSRHWVQVAGGASKADLGREFARLKAKAPKLFAARGAWTTPLRATNRLLVGPFKSSGEAQSFVNELAKAELSAFSWTSPEGQEIEKLGGA